MKNWLVVMLLCVGSMSYSQDWQKSFTEAQELATKEEKVLLLVFTGSDWCAPCIRLDREFFESDTFKNYADKNYVLYKADFPRKKANKLPLALEEEHNKLAEKYNSKGYFPLVVVIKEGDVLGSSSYKKISAEKYLAMLNSFKK